MTPLHMLRIQIPATLRALGINFQSTLTIIDYWILTFLNSLSTSNSSRHRTAALSAEGLYDRKGMY